MYIRLAEGLNKYKLIPEDSNLDEFISSYDKDHYTSIFKYNKEQYEHWKKTKSVAGIKDVVTDRIVLDFDNESDVDAAKRDALIAVQRILTLGIPKENIQITWSGKKGFGIEFRINKHVDHDTFKNIVFKLAGDLPTFDTVVNDPNRIVRVVGTKHQSSGLYKYPLTHEQLQESSIDDIRELAVTNEIDGSLFENNNFYGTAPLPEEYYEKPVKEKPQSTEELTDLDLSNKPRWLTPAKYALQEGYFATGEGVRNTAFMILAATYKNQGFSREIVYRMLKGVAEKQALRTNTDRYPDNELWNNVTKVVFSPNWQGGQYAKDHPLLIETAKRLNLPMDTEDKAIVNIGNVADIFKNFAENIDKNTMKLGVNKIDKNVRITTSMVVGLLGAPSSGKTTLAINFLNYSSINNVKSIFFSLDMGAPLVFQRLIQRHKGLSGDAVFQAYKNKDTKVINEIDMMMDENYKNVSYCFKTGLTVEDIRQQILNEQERSGEKVKLVVVDYLECISGPYSDATANTALIAQKLKDIANDLELTLVLLLQPQKHAGDPSDELLTYRNIKGSSAVEQAASIILSVWRPGFSAKTPQNDRFMSMAVLKNRMGGLSQFDFKWNGLTGTITDLDFSDEDELQEIREAKIASESNSGGGF